MAKSRIRQTDLPHLITQSSESICGTYPPTCRHRLSPTHARRPQQHLEVVASQLPQPESLVHPPVIREGNTFVGEHPRRLSLVNIFSLRFCSFVGRKTGARVEQHDT